MNTCIGCPIIVGVSLPPDYKIDARILTTLERWDRGEIAEMYYIPAPFPTLGRDKIVSYAQYRIPRPTHILFIDADVLPRQKTLDTILSLDKDIVTGVYPITTKRGIFWNVSREEKFTPIEIEELPRNPFKVNHCGNGIMLVKMEVFDKLEWPYWKNVFRPGGIEKDESFYFCDKAREAGFDIWCEPKVKCNHIRMTNLLSVINNNKKGVKQ